MNDKRPTPIDWHAVRRRVEAARAADGGLSSEERLRLRARDLARQPERRTEVGAALDVVVFRLAGETYALETAYVREVYPLRALTPLPGVPPFVAGLVNIRGEIVSAVDLRPFFDLPTGGLTDLNRMIVLEEEDMVFGILADAVPGVRRIPEDEVQPTLPTLTGVRKQYLKGVTGDGTAVLGAEKLLKDPNLIVNETGEMPDGRG